MEGPLFADGSPAGYRAGYLKLKSVLFDRTTGLPAFPVLFDRLRTLLDERPRLGVLHVEAVDLELVESLYGWQVFDRVISRAAGTLRECIGRELPASSLVALNGVAGDRFVLFLPDAGAGESTAAALESAGRGVCEALERVFGSEEFAGLNPRPGFRAGHAWLSIDPFYRFERCVYAAVEEARTFHDRRERRRERSWAEELAGIIRRSAVDVVFQPVVEMRDRKAIGHEAFVRGPRDTIFETPRTMFALSSRVGLDLELDQVCCETALRSFAETIHDGLVFVNVLLGSLEDDAWRGERLPSLLRDLALERASVVLELSERGADADPESFAERLRTYRDEGWRLALDDVGTGRATRATIERVRPDYIKLDGSLVRGVHENLIKQEVLTGLLQLADELDARVVAEGVETEAEAAALTAAGATLGQGYLFAAPALPPMAVRLGEQGR